MLDFSYFQNSGNVNTQTFTNAGTWVTWQKPRGAKFVNILCIGSGGGGGGGFQTGSSGNRNGGAGGGSGGIVRAQFQASVLPDLLYVYTGAGGTGGTGGPIGTVTAGGNGEKSFVAFIPDSTSASNIIVTSGAVSARGGSSGSAVAATAGAGETIATAANSIFFNLGTFLAVAGQAGTAGGSSNATSVVLSNIVTGGGGAGTGTGGGITGAGPFQSLPIAAAGGASGNGANGLNGYMLTKPILGFVGGGGGGGIAGGGTGNAGNGGNGNFGCGGGGGGTAQTGTAGNGGRGGDGIIIITTSL